MKKITLAISMFVLAAVGVNKAYAQGEFDFAQGENYYLIYLDEETVAGSIPKQKIAADYRVDDTVNFLYIWENTYISNPAIGPNSNGVPGAFIDYSVNNIGWSGFGFASLAPGKNLSGISDEHYVHFALKSMGNENHMIIIAGEDKKEAKLNIGSTPFNDNGVIYDPYDNFPRDGEWKSFDIPVKTLKRLGANFSDGFTGNVFAMLSGGVEGTNICLDAVFFYRPEGSNVGSVNADNVEILLSKTTLSVVGIEAGIELYDISGKLLKSTSDSVVGIEDLTNGLYMVRTGDVVKKVFIK